MTRYFCDLLVVSRSGYYSYLKASTVWEAREQLGLEAKGIILKAYNRGYKKGSRSVKMILENDYNLIFSRKKIQRIMRKDSVLHTFLSSDMLGNLGNLGNLEKEVEQ